MRSRSTRTRTLASAITSVGAIAAAFLPGCVAIQGASFGARESAIAPSARADDETGAITPEIELVWPHRWGRASERTQGVIVEMEGPIDDLRPVRLGDHHQLRTPEEEREPVARLAEGVPDVGLYRFRAEGPGSFIFVEAYQDPNEPRSPEETERLLSDADEPAEIFRYVSARPSAPIDAVPHVSIERTWFARYEPFGAEAKGLVVLVPGMFGTPVEIVDSLNRSLRAQGWAVLRMLSHPARFTEHVELEIEATDDDAWAEQWGRVIASIFQGNADEIAYATEAAVLHTLEASPALRDLPHVIVSMSGGAMMTPTIHARAPELYDAAVMIAGGSNILGIILDSNYSDTIDSLRIDWSGRRPTSHEIDTWLASYLRFAPYDPYHTAALMREKPVLLLHAAKDKAVPAATGDELWQRLGEPERWVYPVGHELIFLMLPTQYKRLGDWLDAHVLGETPTAETDS